MKYWTGLRLSVPIVILGVLAGTPAGSLAEGKKEPTYQERLELGLRARRPSEVEFVAAVVDLVNRGKLPRRLVDRTYFWARERSVKHGGRKQRRPIIYFQPALTRQAEKLGIKIGHRNS